MTAAFVSTLLLLGIVGWSAGWVAAGSEIKRQGHVDATTTTTPGPTRTSTSSPSPARSSTTPSPTYNSTPTGTPSRPDQFEMPNLVNRDFRVARALATDKRLGVNVNFNEPSRKTDGQVERTAPEAGVYVWPGVTIQLYVAGPPPKVLVPDILGKPCDDGKIGILDSGLKIQDYPSGMKGNVTKVEPTVGIALNWNDKVRIFCG